MPQVFDAKTGKAINCDRDQVEVMLKSKAYIKDADKAAELASKAAKANKTDGSGDKK